jgi:gliding motility-associated-like protein
MFNGFNISCNGMADGSVSINLTSGSPPYVYSWQGPDGFTANTRDISNLKAGQYVLSVTDLNMCTVEDTIVLTEPGRMGMTITRSESITGGFNLNCAGDKTGTISVQALNYAGAADYLWADGALGADRTGLQAGTYRVIITDLNNCSIDSTITLTAPGPLQLSATVTQPFCSDMPNGEIALTVTGGVPEYSFLWSDNSTSQNLVNATDLINDEWHIGLRELYPEMEVKIFNRWGELVWKSEKGYPRPWDGRSNGVLLPMDSYHYTIDLHNGSKLMIGTITIVK